MIGKTTFSLLPLLILLSSCVSYKSTFGCPDANGARCMPIDKIDKMITSGEIERFSEANQNKKKDKNLKSLLKNVRPATVEFIGSSNDK